VRQIVVVAFAEVAHAGRSRAGRAHSALDHHIAVLAGEQKRERLADDRRLGDTAAASRPLQRGGLLVGKLNDRSDHARPTISAEGR
jgi:hypothetical protein